MARSRQIALNGRLVTVALAVAGLVMAIAAPAARAASTTVNLDQWASSAATWQNGNLNGNNSRYPEGGIVPFRLAIAGLSVGVHTIHIDYDVTAGGHKAYDFLATWDVTNAKGRICTEGGGAVSSMCPSLPASSSYPFPSDTYVMNGLSVRGAEQYSGSPRRLTIWGGTITSISAPAHAGSPNGNSTGNMLVRFRATGSAVLLAWGGHLAQSAYWDQATGGAPDGAAQVSGAPWHMRTLRLDGAGARNQDRSIQPSAIVGALPPQALAPPTPRPTPVAPAPTGPTATPAGPGSGATPPPGGPNDPAGPVPDPLLTPPPTSVDDRSRPTAPSPNGAVLLSLFVLAGTLTGVLARRRHRS
jgi:hypothetical protein